MTNLKMKLMNLACGRENGAKPNHVTSHSSVKASVFNSRVPTDQASESPTLLTETSLAELKVFSSDGNMSHYSDQLQGELRPFINCNLFGVKLSQYVMSRTNWFKFLKHAYDELCSAYNQSDLVERDLLM